MMNIRLLAVSFIIGLRLSGSAAAGAEPLYDVDVTVTNAFDKEFSNLPVFFQVSHVFGRGVDYAKFNRDGFHVYESSGKELEFFYRPMPPSFSLAAGEIIVVLPSLAKGGELKFRFTNTPEKSSKEAKLNIDAIVDNPNNLIPNGGFEKGLDGWEGGKIVSDVVKSGKNALLLEVPVKGGKASVKCGTAFTFVKDRDYYFGLWAKSENVVRWGLYRDDWGGQIAFSNDVLAPYLTRWGPFPTAIKIGDNRDWYCYRYGKSVKDGPSTLSISLNQNWLAYLDPDKPARIWIDEAMLFEQPRLSTNYERTLKTAAPNGFFLYRRAVTALGMVVAGAGQLYCEAPKPYEKIAVLRDAAAQGEHKLLTLGIRTPAPIKALSLGIGELKNAGGKSLAKAPSEVEFFYTPEVNYNFTATSLEGWVLDGNDPRDIDRPGHVDYLIGYRLPPDAAPGVYKGTIKVNGDGKELAAMPVELEVVGYQLKVLKNRFIGEDDNGDCSAECNYIVGGGQAPRTPEFWAYFSRCNFTYVAMFNHFLPFKDAGVDVDIPKLIEKLKELRDVGGFTAGVGLYWDCSMDKQGGRTEGGSGLWARCNRNLDAFHAAVKNIEDGLATEKDLPRLMYMLLDEPKFFDEKKYTVLKDIGALSTGDIFMNEMSQCIEKGGAFTHPSMEDVSFLGPQLYQYARKHGVRMGMLGWPMHDNSRYQTGIMLAVADMPLWHHWHVNEFVAYHPHFKKFARGLNMVGIGEGITDLRYFDTLRDAIEQAKAKNAAKTEVDAAEKYLKGIFDYYNGDFNRYEIYNGSPEDLGDDWFYDHWRSEMRRLTQAILAAR